MDISLLIILTSLVLAVGAIFYFLNLKFKKLQESTKEDETTRLMSEWIKQVLDQTQATRKEMQDRLDSTGKMMGERLDNAARLFGKVSKDLGEMSEIGRQMKDLQDFLKSPKLRGNIGEQVLKELLGQMLPKQSFYLQYSFKSGNVVDAAIKTASGIIPIDSKFPLEGFRKMTGAESEQEKKQAEKQFVNDVRKHIRDISSKYILTEEGTIDYALMYIPSEAVYYEVVNNPDLFEYAGGSRVLPVSPMTFYAYLKAILMSFEGQKIEEKARSILNSLKAIRNDSEKFGEDLRVLVKHVTEAKVRADQAATSFLSLSTKIDSAQSISGEEPSQLPFEKEVSQ